MEVPCSFLPTQHSELVWDASVVQAPSMFRKEANSFLHIHTLVLIGSLLLNFNRFLHWRGAGRRRGFHWSSSTCTGRSCIIATLFRFRFSISQIQGAFYDRCSVYKAEWIHIGSFAEKGDQQGEEFSCVGPS